MSGLTDADGPCTSTTAFHSVFDLTPLSGMTKLEESIGSGNERIRIWRPLSGGDRAEKTTCVANGDEVYRTWTPLAGLAAC